MNIAPYLALRWGYRGEGGGVDCWQLVCRVAREQFGLDYQDSFGAVPDRLRDQALTMDAERAKWTEVAVPEPGDVVLITVGGLPVHVGIMLDQRRFLHILKPGRADRERYASVSEVDSLIWKSRIAGYYRQ